jgi:hypothetical protein
MMRGRIGLCVAVAAAGLILGGCQSQQQKEQARAQKQAAQQREAQARAQKQQQEAQAKAERDRIAAQQRAEQQRIADERKRAEAYAAAEQQRLAQQRALAEQQARAERDKAAAQAKVDADRMAQQQQAERERAEAQARLDAQNAAAAERANQERAAAEAAERKRQAALARGQKPPKAEKVKPYPDDEVAVIGEPYIRPENYTSLFDRHTQAMSAAGAAQDASLYDQHFDGAELNALGRSKVALMLQGAPRNEPLTIYVPPSGPSERVQARLASVNQFWRDSQWAAMQVQTKQGVAPENTTSAAQGLAGLRRLEREQQEGGTTGGGAQTGDTVGTTGRPTGGQ